MRRKTLSINANGDRGKTTERPTLLFNDQFKITYEICIKLNTYYMYIQNIRRIGYIYSYASLVL